MVSLRPFTSFLFGLTITISLFSSAFSHKDMEEKPVLVAATSTFSLFGRSPLSLSKEKFDTRVDARIEEIGGRKTMKKEMLKKQGINNVNETPKSSKILGATSNSCKLKRSKQRNIDFNPSDRRSYNINVGHHLHRHRHRRMNAGMDGSAPLDDADYKAPKSHPPKNN